MKYGIPRGSISELLHFGLYIFFSFRTSTFSFIDLSKAFDTVDHNIQLKNTLDPIIFADETNLFYSNKDINTVFLKVNNELQKINEWFISNKFSLNVKKNPRFSTNLAKKMIFH